MSKIIVTGATSGLGAAIAEALDIEHEVILFDKSFDSAMDVTKPENYLVPDDLDMLVNCAGITRMDWFDRFGESEWDDVMNVNLKGILLMSQHCYTPLYNNRGTILNIVSDAAHKPMRCSAAYNASKAAALMLTKVMAREAQGSGMTIFSVSPNRMHGTGMSDFVDEEVQRLRGFTREQLEESQAKYTSTGRETPPEVVSDFIAYLLRRKENHRYLHGCDIQYGD